MSSPLDELDPRARRIVDLAADLARRLAPGEIEADRTSQFPLAHYDLLHEAGYLRLGIPREHGGEGASVLELVLAQEQLAHAGAALGISAGMLFNVVGKLTTSTTWPRELAAYMLGKIAREGGLANMVVTEPELGSISRGGVPATTAEPVAGGFVVNGHKVFVTAAPGLRFLLTLVRLPPTAAAPTGSTAVAVVEAPAKGLRIESTWRDSLSQRSGGNDDVYYENVFVPDAFVVERTPIGQPPLAAGPGAHWLAMVAVYLGVGQAALDAAITYAHQRVPSVLGQPLASVEPTQRLIGEAHVTLSAARALLYAAAERCSKPGVAAAEVGAHVAGAKYTVTHAACHATELALRVAGGFGLTSRLTLERHFRDARGGLFQALQDDLALRLLGRHVLDAHAPAPND
ncbi:MAG: acyl-CoA dehydrogenase family protein [Polyangiales bacterium]